MKFLSRKVHAIFGGDAISARLLVCLTVVGSASCGAILGNDFTFESGPKTSSGSNGGSTSGPSSGNAGGGESTASAAGGSGGTPTTSGAGGNGGVASGGGGATGGSSGKGGGTTASSTGAAGGTCMKDVDCKSLSTDCTEGQCDMQSMMCRVTNLQVETMCQGGFCDGNGTCVECVAQHDCSDMGMMSACINNKCVMPNCSDGIQDGNETDVDCGGGSMGNCPKCKDGKKCVMGTNCLSGVCTNEVCIGTCMNMTKDGNETDVDCGGGDCPTCGGGKRCDADTDCTSGSCTVGFCTN